MSSGPTSSNNRGPIRDDTTERQRLRAMTDEQITAAALADPDNPPLTPEQLARMRRPALAKRIRQKLRMGRDTFSVNYGIPLDTLVSWERHEAEPTPAEMAYLRLIEREPEVARLVQAA